VTTRPALVIVHAITLDDPLGCPWPPDGNGWVLARQLARQFSLWRRIEIKTPTVIEVSS